MNPKPRDFDYDVALSFAGEDRPIAQGIAEKLSARQIRVFYDQFEESNLWGKNLYDYLADVYSKRAAFCLMILSRSYAEKTWTTHERQNAQARAFNENREYILPLRLDDTKIPGIGPTVGYIDYRTSSIDKIVDLLECKLKAACSDNEKREQQSRSDLGSSLLSLDLSKTALGIITDKHDGWECALFLDVLQLELESARSLKLELQWGIVTGKARQFEIYTFFKWVAAQFDLMARQVGAFEKLVAEGVNVALGRQEDEGDPTEICLVARKIGALYKWAAEWGVEFRSVSVDTEFAHLLELYANSAQTLMNSVEELYGGLKSGFDYWCSLDLEDRAAHKSRVEITLEPPNTGEIATEVKRLQKLYGF